MNLNLEPNFSSPDTFYATLMDAYQKVGDKKNHLLNSGLVLLLANHIGDQDVLEEAIQIAKKNAAEMEVSCEQK